MSRDIERVKFYLSNDLSCSYYVDRIEEILNSVIEIKSINDVLEFYNIQQFFENKLYSNSWTEEQIEEHIKKAKCLNKHIGIYWSKINDLNINELLGDVELDYVDDFWKLFEKYKLYESISEQAFKGVFDNSKFRITDVLSNRNISKTYGRAIKQYMSEQRYCAEIIIREYLESQDNKKSKYYFPGELTVVDKSDIIEKYIDSKMANANYLKLVYESQGNSGLNLSSRLKLKAKRVYEKQWEEIESRSTGITYGVNVRFSKEQIEPKEFDLDQKRILCVSYSVKWIEDNLDYPTILNNFIYLFDYTDLQFRVQYLHRVRNVGLFDRIRVKGVREYSKDAAFNQLQGLSQLQILGYYSLLEHNNIRLEDVVKWFFEVYLNTEFEAKGFYFNPPSQGTTYIEKYRTIASEIDSVLKQYKLWVEDGEIDYELMQMSSEHIFMRNIPSQIEQKYIYPVEKKFGGLSEILFSSQSILCHISKVEEDYKSFYELLNNEKLKYEDFREYQKPALQLLLSNKLVWFNVDGVVCLSKQRVSLLKELYENEVICSHYRQSIRKVLDDFSDEDIITYEASLFSKPEQDYFNYILNKSEFSNGLDLRNKYIHGTQTMNAEENMQDYYILLKLLVLIVIKINEEFCILDESRKR